jgi:hypothetical protein
MKETKISKQPDCACLSMNKNKNKQLLAISNFIVKLIELI